MARPRKATNILEISGAFKKHPERKRSIEPKPTGKLGSPPKYFNKEKKAIWRELARNYKMCKLANSDRLALESLTCLVHEFRENPENFSGAKYGRMIALFGQFGGSPSERSKVSIKDGESKNDFSEF